ncbi:MAG: flagellar protein FliO/FliZ [Oleispira sp.]|jgi:flagellar protein FliO/FliZ
MIQGFAFLLCWMPLWLQAEDALSQKTPLPADPMSSIGRVALTLVGMIAFILLLAYFAKRLQGMSRSNVGGFGGQGKLIKTLATTSIGLKEKISLIQVGDQQLLIGITPQSIQTLLVLETPIQQEDIEQQTPVFQAILKKALHKA